MLTARPPTRAFIASALIFVVPSLPAWADESDEGICGEAIDTSMPVTWLVDEHESPSGILRVDTLKHRDDMAYLVSVRLLLANREMSWVLPKAAPTSPGEALDIPLEVPKEAFMLDVQTHAVAELFVTVDALAANGRVATRSIAPWIGLTWPDGRGSEPQLHSRADVERDGWYNVDAVPFVEEAPSPDETGGVPRAVVDAAQEVVP